MDPSAADPAAALALLRADPHRPFAELRRAAGERAEAIDHGAEAALEASVADGRTALVTAGPVDAPVAAAAVRRGDWDSDNFGVEVLRTDRLAIGPSVDRVTAAEDLGRRLLGGAAPTVVFATVAAGDVDALLGLQRAGFEVYDNLLDFAAVPGAAPERPGSAPGNVQEFGAVDLDAGAAASADEVDLLASLAPGLFHHSHLFADERLPDERVAAAYEHWVRAVFSGEWSDHLTTSRDDDGSLASFVSFSHADRRPEGPVVLTGSFGFSVPPHRRGHTGRLTDRVLRHAPADLVVSVVQSRNLTQVNGLHRGGMTVVRASVVLHGWSA